MKDKAIGFIMGFFLTLVIMTIFVEVIPEYSMIYKQAVKDTLTHQNKGRVSCELVIHDVREDK